MIQVRFPGGQKVEGVFTKTGLSVMTDQPVRDGGEGSAPAPFQLFLLSLATCAGYYLNEFLVSRKIPVEGVDLRMEYERDPETHLVGKVLFNVTLPPGFPEKYKAAVVRAMAQCTVKRQIEHPPAFETRTNLD